MYVVKKLISGSDLKVGALVDASAWPNVGALRRSGFLEPAALSPSAPAPTTKPSKGRRSSEED